MLEQKERVEREISFFSSVRHVGERAINAPVFQENDVHLVLLNFVLQAGSLWDKGRMDLID